MPTKLPSRTTAMVPAIARACALIERRELGARRSGLQHSAVQHVGQRQLVDEPRTAEHLVRQIEPRRGRAGNTPGLGRLGGDPRRGIACQQIVVRQLPIAGAQIARSGDIAVLDVEALRRHTQPLCRQLQIYGPRLRRGVAHCRARLLDRKAARGGALVGARSGRHLHHADAVKADVELVGRDLRQSGDDALTELDLAGAQLDEAFMAEAQPLREPRVGLQVDRQLRGHGLASLAARSTARTMRLWAPQRHRLRSSAARTWGSLGLGLCASSAAAEMRMPERQ